MMPYSKKLEITMEEQIVLIINLLIFIIQQLNQLNPKPIKLNQILFR